MSLKRGLENDDGCHAKSAQTSKTVPAAESECKGTKHQINQSGRQLSLKELVGSTSSNGSKA